MAARDPLPASPFRSMESNMTSHSPSRSQSQSSLGASNGEAGGVSWNAGSIAGHEAQGATSRSDTESDSVNFSTLTNQLTTQKTTEGQQQRPKYQDYVLKYVRKATFKNWPPHLRQTPETMADAGFFQKGNLDSVRCYYCGIGLRNWDPEDDPWVEHARWASKCVHVLNRKGQEFIDLVQAAVRQQQMQEALEQSPPDDLTVDCPPPQKELPNEIAPSTETGPSRAEKKNPLLTEAAQSVLAMGYLPKVVKKAVDIVLENKGWRGMTGENIANVVFEMEDSGEVEPEKLLVPVKMFDGSNLRTENKSFTEKDLNQLESETNEMRERILCKICCENPVSIVFLPCGHLVSCAQCSPALKNCPVCRIFVKGTVRVCFT